MARDALDKYLKLTVLLKRFASSYALALAEALEQCETKGTCALAIRRYLDLVLESLDRTTILGDLKINAVGCDLLLPIFNTPLTFAYTLGTKHPIRLLRHQDFMFSQRWCFSTTYEHPRTFSFSFGDEIRNADEGLYASCQENGILEVAPHEEIRALLLPEHLANRNSSDLAYADNPFYSCSPRRDRDFLYNEIERSIACQSWLHDQLSIPLTFVSFVGSVHNLELDPVLMFSLCERPDNLQRTLLRVVGQELIHQLMTVVHEIRSRANTTLFSSVASTLRYTHNIRHRLDECADVLRDVRADTTEQRGLNELTSLHNQVLRDLIDLDEHLLAYGRRRSVLNAEKVKQCIMELFKKQVDNIEIVAIGDEKVWFAGTAMDLAELIGGFIQNSLARVLASGDRFGQPGLTSQDGATTEKPVRVKISVVDLMSAWATIPRFFEWQGPEWPKNTLTREPDALIQVDITDTGPGIPKAVLLDIERGKLDDFLASRRPHGGRGIANTLLYLRNTYYGSYSYDGYWSIKIACHSTEGKEANERRFRNA